MYPLINSWDGWWLIQAEIHTAYIEKFLLFVLAWINLLDRRSMMRSEPRRSMSQNPWNGVITEPCASLNVYDLLILFPNLSKPTCRCWLHWEISVVTVSETNDSLLVSSTKVYGCLMVQVINETLRVANIISGVFRRATTDIHFKGQVSIQICCIFQQLLSCDRL